MTKRTHTAAGDEYDPTTMEAEFVDGDKDDVVLSVTEKGYEVGGRMVRRAGVTVSVTAATRAAREKVEAGGDGEGEEAAEGAEE